MSRTSCPAGRCSDLAESFLLMGTVVRLHVVGDRSEGEMHAAIEAGIGLMRDVETTLTRFDDESALRRLCRTPGELVPVPPMLFHALKVSLAVAALTDGVFDPTVAPRMEALGFNRHYLTGARVHSDIAPGSPASFHDITLVDDGCRVRLERPMALDLDAVAKGLAVDLAARSLEGWDGYLIDAGGDVFVSGRDPEGMPWRVGIEDPADPAGILCSVRLDAGAVCTSGSAKRQSEVVPGAHHLVDARSGEPVTSLLSCTVAGPQAMMADAVSTAAFLMGPEGAIGFIEQMGLEGLCVARDGATFETTGMTGLKDAS